MNAVLLRIYIAVAMIVARAVSGRLTREVLDRVAVTIFMIVRIVVVVGRIRIVAVLPLRLPRNHYSPVHGRGTRVFSMVVHKIDTSPVPRRNALSIGTRLCRGRSVK
jgi:hypothetical protein